MNGCPECGCDTIVDRYDDTRMLPDGTVSRFYSGFYCSECEYEETL